MKSSRTHYGFSIIEILIAVIIIGVLSAVLIPTLLNRAAQAKLVACQDELERLAEAQRRAGIEMGYYLRLFALDDVAGTDGRATTNPDDRIDSIEDEVWVENVPPFYAPLYLNLAPIDPYPYRLFIDVSTHEFLDSAIQKVVFDRVKSAKEWRGPYYSIRRDADVRPDPPPGLPRRYRIDDPPVHVYDIPDDPWGNDYLLFMPQGIVAEPRGEILSRTLGELWTLYGVQYDTEVFDRPTILSMGPNGVPGNPPPAPPEEQVFGRGDDVFLSFEF